MTEAYPLQWPPAWPRSDEQTRSRFGKWNAPVSVARGVADVMHELKLLEASGIVISTNIPVGKQGMPLSDKREPQDPGVAVYFIREGKSQCIPCDKWGRVGDNLRAIAKTIEALRGIERWGAKNMVDAAFQGFKALPSPEMVMAMPQLRSWHVVLGVSPEAPPEVRKAAYRALARMYHPDQGGTRQAWDELQRAAKEAGVQEERSHD